MLSNNQYVSRILVFDAGLFLAFIGIVLLLCVPGVLGAMVSAIIFGMHQGSSTFHLLLYFTMVYYCLPAFHFLLLLPSCISPWFITAFLDLIEVKRFASMGEKRVTRKNRLQQQQAGAGGGDPSFVRGVCQRDCHSRIGLVSHSRTHRTLATDLVILGNEGRRRRHLFTRPILITRRRIWMDG